MTNHGPDATAGVHVGDLLPAGLTYVSDTPSVGTYDSTCGDWTLGGMAVGAVETLQMTATVGAEGPITNIAEVTASSLFDPNSTPGNNAPGENDQASAVLNSRGVADLSVAKTVTPTTVHKGDKATYTLVVTNHGPDAASGVIVRDQLSAGVTFVSGAGGTYDPHTEAWTVGNMGQRQLRNPHDHGPCRPVRRDHQYCRRRGLEPARPGPGQRRSHHRGLGRRPDSAAYGDERPRLQAVGSRPAGRLADRVCVCRRCGGCVGGARHSKPAVEAQEVASAGPLGAGDREAVAAFADPSPIRSHPGPVADPAPLPRIAFVRGGAPGYHCRPIAVTAAGRASRACSSADRASASGAEGRRFESCRARFNHHFWQSQGKAVGVGGRSESG